MNKKATSPYLLSLDIGTTSIGYAVFLVNEQGRPCFLHDGGVRVFPHGKNPEKNEPLNVARSNARRARKARKYAQNRVRAFSKKLIEFGLLPDSRRERDKLFDSIDPYEARACCADDENAASKVTLGRALFHICRRRGFKSNRIMEAGIAVKKEQEALRDQQKRIYKLKGVLEDKHITLGQLLWEQQKSNKSSINKGQNKNLPSIRFKPEKKNDGVSWNDGFFADRSMYSHEWDAIKKAQGNTHLTNAQWDELKELAFYQRPLRPIERGSCAYMPNEYRAFSCTPSAERYLALTAINDLTYTLPSVNGGSASCKLTNSERKDIIEKLAAVKELKVSDIEKRYLPKYAKLNTSKKKFVGLTTTKGLTRVLGDKLVSVLGLEALDALVELLLNPIKKANGSLDYLTDGEIDSKIKELTQSTSEELVIKVRAFANELPANRNVTKVSNKLMRAALPHLEQGKGYWEAVKALGFNHSLRGADKEYEKLPYYGIILADSVWGKEPHLDRNKEGDRDEDAYKYGKIGNPNVHIALNQVRYVVNKIIDKMGSKPSHIHLEITRDLKMSKPDKAKFEKKIKENEKTNKRINKELKALGQEPNGRNRAKYKLWEELGANGNVHKTIFTGSTIPISKLFTPEIEIEHIIPKSLCFDDGMQNKTLAFTSENRHKGNREPSQVPEFNQEEMQIRADNVFKNNRGKQMRFYPDARAKIYGENGEKVLLNRELNDTAYISKKTAQYLACLFPPNEITSKGNRIVTVRGRYTGRIRHFLGLNRYKDKNSKGCRLDHRHHLVDAFVIGLVSRKMIHEMTSRKYLNKEAGHPLAILGLGRAMEHHVPRLQNMIGQLDELLERVIISHKPKRSMVGEAALDSMLSEAEVDGVKGWYKRDKIESLSLTKIMKLKSAATKNDLIKFLLGRECIDGIQTKKNLTDAFRENYGIPKGKKGDSESGKKLTKLLHLFGKEKGIFSVSYRAAKYKAARKVKSAGYNKGVVFAKYAFAEVWLAPPEKGGSKTINEYRLTPIPFAKIREYEQNPDSFRPHPAAKKIMRLYGNDTISVMDKHTGEVVFYRLRGFTAVESITWEYNHRIRRTAASVSVDTLFANNKIGRVNGL